MIREVTDREPYDPEATCPKCGAGPERVSSKYRDHKLDQVWFWNTWMPTWLGPPAMERACGRCEFKWYQAPVGQS